MTSSLRRGVLALTTHFRLPHEGMEAFEVLSRGSAMLTHRLYAPKSSNLHVLTCAHVACPWLFPGYYPQEWLQHVDESFVKHTLALREPTSGQVAWEVELEAHVAVHGTRDLAVLEWKNYQQEVHAFDISEPYHVSENETLEFLGHTQPDETQVIPKSVAGSFFWMNPNTKQAFAKSESVLEQGMCGGAAVANNGRDVVGLIEGIVPVMENASAAYKMLENQVAFVPRDDLTTFVQSVESKDDLKLIITGTGLI